MLRFLLGREWLKNERLQYISMLWAGGISLASILLFKAMAKCDSEALDQAAVQFMQSNFEAFQAGEYFYMYPFQLGYTAFMELIYRLFGVEKYIIFQLINMVCIVDIVYVNDGIMTFGSGSIDWSVPAGTRYVTSSIYMAKGTEVQIACTASPSTCTYWFGLMAANSDCYVVEGSGAGAHVFTVPSNGYYRIMVENRSIQSINVSGTYRY